MTTTVKRGAGRPAATERRNRHAQTTPLPPRETPREEFLRLTALPLAEQTPKVQARIRKLGNLPENTGPRPDPETPVPGEEEGTERANSYGRMTVDELKARAHQLGGIKPMPRTKGALMNAILAEEQRRRHLRAVANAEQEPQEEGWDGAAPMPAEPAATKSQAKKTVPAGHGVAAGTEAKGLAKAERFRSDVKAGGWETEVTAPAEGRVMAIATRAAEILTVTWDRGVFNYELSGHVISDRTTKVRNVSHARQLADRSEEEASKELERVGANRAWRRKEPQTSTPRGKLPFDPETASLEEIRAALLGKRVVWINRIAQAEESAVVSPSERYFKVTGEGAERAVQCTTEVGFRAFRLSTILRVGGGSQRKAPVKAA